MNRGLSRTRIVEAALKVVQEHGLAKLSMRRIAALLEVEAMSLYHHVKNKEDLLSALHDHLISGVEVPVDGTWQEKLQAMALRFREQLFEHRQLVPLLAGRAAGTPPTLAVLEGGVGVLTDAGWSEGDAVDAFQTVFCFVVGHSIFHTSGGMVAPDDAWSSREFQAGLQILIAGLEASR